MINTESVSIIGESRKPFEDLNGEKTIDETRLGDIWKRFAAHIFDVLLVNLFVFLILIAATLATDLLAEVYTITFANLALFVYFESSKAQATPGKKYLNLKVVDFEDKRISFRRVFPHILREECQELFT